MSWPDWNKDSLQAWSANADSWNDGVGQGGNQYWNMLQLPCLKRLVPLKKGMKALDLATGNGLVARWLAAEGADVIATDGSERMLEHAVQRASEAGLHLDSRKLDVTQPQDFEELLAFSASSTDGGFDIVTLNMAIMDIPVLDPLAQALPKLLKKGGVFVATMLHPVFFTCGAYHNVAITTDAVTGRREVIRTQVIKDYLHVSPWRGVALETQPEHQMYFHRPLHELFSVFFRTGLVMDAVEEPAFQEAYTISTKVEATSNFTQIPPLFAFRLRRF